MTASNQQISPVAKNYDLTLTITLCGNWKNARKNKDAVEADFADVAAGVRQVIEDELEYAYAGSHRWSITDSNVVYDAKPA